MALFKFKPAQLVFPALLGLAACGSSGGGSCTECGLDDYGSMSPLLDFMSSDAKNAPATTVMPSGKAQYDTRLGLNKTADPATHLNGNAEYIAHMELNADFDKNSISGSITNLVDAKGNHDNTAIYLTNGSITNNGFDAKVGGGFTGTMGGEFRDKPGDTATAGLVQGTMQVTYGLDQYFGTFAGYKY